MGEGARNCSCALHSAGVAQSMQVSADYVNELSLVRKSPLVEARPTKALYSGLGFSEVGRKWARTVHVPANHIGQRLDTTMCVQMCASQYKSPEKHDKMD